MSARSTTAILAATAAALTMTVTLGGSAGAVAAAHQVRKADFLTGYSDTRPSGQWGFGPHGLVVETKDNSSNAKVAEYFAPATPAFPSSGSYVWDGTTTQPGSQIVFSVPGYAYNVLVGEQVYSTGSDGQPLTDWWMTGGSDRAALRGIVCPSTSTGYGSNCHGTLAQWKAALPASTTVPAVGFSLGSGIQGLRRADVAHLRQRRVRLHRHRGGIHHGWWHHHHRRHPGRCPGRGHRYGDPPQLRAQHPGDAHLRRSAGRCTEAAKLQWKILTGPRGGTLHVRLSDSMGAGETLGWGFTFPAHQSRREVRILRNGVMVADYTVK